MKGKWIFWLKVALLLAVAGVVAWKLHAAWVTVAVKHIAIDWRWGGVALLGFAGALFTSACVWRWLARRMGDRSPAVPLVGAYMYSQIGKYIPGKVVLLWWRIERSSRCGMTPAVCTLSTLLENTLFMISGGIVGMLAIVRITGEVDPAYRPLLWPVTIAAVLLMIAACAPPVFYPLVNVVLRKMKQPEAAREQRLGAGTLALAAAGFVPCWCFGGLALWGSLNCVNFTGHAVGLADCWWFAGAFALSVMIGMASLLPGGAGIREAALGAAVALQFSTMGVPHGQAVLLGGVAAILLRLFQLIVEVILGVGGMLLTSKSSPPPALSQNPLTPPPPSP